MTAHGIVMQPGEGLRSSNTPGREFALKLLCRDTGDSMMVFEETVPAGTKSTLHLHHDSDELAYVLEGEVTFLIGDEVTVGGPGACAFMPRGIAHAWKNTGIETGRVLFMYAPAAAGKWFEDLQKLHRPVASVDPEEIAAIHRRYQWEIVGPSPL